MRTSVRSITEALSKDARRSIDSGDDHEWYAVTHRAADELEERSLCRRPISHDRRVCVPNALGLEVRNHLKGLP